MCESINRISYLQKAEAGEFMEEIIDIIRGENFDEERMKMAIAFEEAFMNIANHAYPSGEGPVSVSLLIKDNAIEVVLDDCGVPYDPTKAKVEEMTDECQIGGHGIRLMKTYCNLYYERVFGHNMLKMVSKNI